MHFPEVKQGVIVRHPQFGEGKVIARYGEDENSKAIIKFKEEGEKKLSLKFAKLLVDEPEPVAEETPEEV